MVGPDKQTSHMSMLLIMVCGGVVQHIVIWEL